MMNRPERALTTQILRDIIVGNKFKGRDIAGLALVHETTISRILCGRKQPSLDEAQRIAYAILVLAAERAVLRVHPVTERLVIDERVPGGVT